MVENITFSHLSDCWWKKHTKNRPLKTPKYFYPVIACFSAAITWPKPWVSSSKKMTTTLGALVSKVSEMLCKTGGIHAKDSKNTHKWFRWCLNFFRWILDVLTPIRKMWETISRNRLVVSQNKGYPQSSFICRWIFRSKFINNHPFTDPFFDIHHKPSIIDWLMDKPAINHPFIDGYPSHKPSIYRWFFPSFHGRKSTEKLATAPAECPPAWVNARGARRDRCERPPGFSHRERRKTHGKIMGKIMVIAWWIMVNDDGSWLLMRK